MEPILPDVDIWMRAFSRQDPDPLIVHAFSRRVRDRQVFLLGWIRQGLLARVRDERQFARLSWLLSAFPDLRVTSDDHVRAATLARTLRGQGLSIAPWPALLWAVSDRLNGRIWSQGRQWRAWTAHGCRVSS
ncbi:MAG: hypothetical protein H0V44_18925 [Planctomycetes bacterium]|nr:hypothetical protein [Planctomycetota bacterium]